MSNIVSARRNAASILVAVVVVALFTSEGFAACILPMYLVGSITTVVEAPSARGVGIGYIKNFQGEICTAFSLSATAKIKEYGVTIGTDTTSGVGEAIVTAYGPGRWAYCYTSSIQVESGIMPVFTADGAEACLYGPPSPPPPPPPPPPGDEGTDDGGCGCGSPIIIDVLGNGYALTDSTHGVIFDIDGDGNAERLSWTAPGDDGFLWLDENGNGAVDNGNELFGDAAYPNGFEKLALYDRARWGGNEDGHITAADASWLALRVWTDGNHNGVSEPAEIVPLPNIGVYSIDLKYEVIGKRDKYGNRFRYKGTVETTTGKDKIYDVVFVRLTN